MKQLLNKPFYPLFLCTNPIIYQAAQNIKVISFADPVRSLLITLGVTVFLLVAFRLILREWDRPALLTAFIITLFFSFGQVAERFQSISPGLWAIICLVIFLFGFVLIMLNGRADWIAPFLNIGAGALVSLSLGWYIISALTLYTIINDERDITHQLRDEVRAEASASLSAGPDIYYIILDSYERADALRKYYGYDNSNFIQALEARGFYVAAQSRANYLTTAYALPAALNMVYLNEIPERNFTRITSGLQDNHAAEFLKARGYTSVHFESGFEVTDNAMYDVWVSPTGQHIQSQRLPVNKFELMLLRISLGYLLIGTPSSNPGEDDFLDMALQQDFDIRRTRIEYAFTHLPDYTAADGSFFLFAHILSPHTPYIYGPNGEIINYEGNFFLYGDKTNSQRNIRLYNDQLEYINRRVLTLIDRIQAESTEPSVIIIQADHGHDTFFDWDELTPEGADLRSAILNAVYFPDGDYSALYPSISPVNTFRVLFNRFFDTSYPLLPDRTYYHLPSTTILVTSKPVFEDIQPYLDRLPMEVP